MDEQQHIGSPTRWIDAVRAVRAIDAADRWSPDLTAAGVGSGIIHLARDGRAIILTEALQGATVLHRVTAAEVAGGFLLLDPDLTAFEVPVAIGVRTTCGDPVGLATVATAGHPGGRRPDPTSPRVALGPPAWLGWADPGQLVEVGLLDDTLIVQPVVERRPPAARLGPLVRAVRTSAAAELDRGPTRVAQLLAVVVDLVEVGPDLLHAGIGVPLGELLRRAGLRHAHGWLTDDPGIDLDVMVGAESPPGQIARGGSRRPAELLAGVIARYRMRVPDPDDGHRRQVVAALDDPGAVLLAAASAAASPGVPLLVADLDRQVSRPRRAVLQHLLAAHHLAHGRVAAAVEALERSLHLDASSSIVPGLLAELRWICGDHAAAATLDPSRVEAARELRDGGASWELEELLDAMPSYEDPGPDPVAQARQLWRRARWYADMYGGHDLRRAQARRLAVHPLLRFPEQDRAGNLLEQFGGLARFAAEVGPVLPADEQALVQQWLGCRRRWWRMAGMQGRVVRLDPLDGGPATDAVGPWREEDVTDEAAAEDHLACALVLPTGDPDHRILGGTMFTVPAHRRPLPPPEDVIGVVARMIGDPVDPGWAGPLAA